MAEIKTILTADGSQLKQALAEASADAKKFANQGLGEIKGKLAQAFAVGAIVEFARHTVEVASQIGDLSKQTGISTTELQRLGFAAKLNGSSMEAVAQGLTKLNSAQFDALSGNEKLRKNFEGLGISLEDLRTKRAEDIFMKLAEAAKNSADPGKTMSDILEVMGNRSRELIPLLLEGQNGIKALGDEAERTGAVIGESTVAELKNLNDEMDKLKSKSTAAFAPVLANLAKGANFAADFVSMSAKLTTMAVDPNSTKADMLGAMKTFANPPDPAKIESKAEQAAKFDREVGETAEDKKRKSEEERKEKRINDMAKQLAEEEQRFALSQLDTEAQLLALERERANIQEDLDNVTDDERNLELQRQLLKVKEQIFNTEKKLNQEDEASFKDFQKKQEDRDDHLKKLGEISRGEGVSTSAPLTDSLARIGGFVGNTGGQNIRIGERQLEIQKNMEKYLAQIAAKNQLISGGGDAIVGN